MRFWLKTGSKVVKIEISVENLRWILAPGQEGRFGQSCQNRLLSRFWLFWAPICEKHPPDPYIQKTDFCRPLKCVNRKILKKTHFEDFVQNVDPIGHFGPPGSGHLRNSKMYNALLKILEYRFIGFIFFLFTAWA